MKTLINLLIVLTLMSFAGCSKDSPTSNDDDNKTAEL